MGPEPFVASTFDLDIVNEASGVASSLRNPTTLYVLDDGPGSTGVLAIDVMTGDATTLIVDGLNGRDTEGLAVGACTAWGTTRRRGSRPTCLFIGDIGNNQEAWESIDVWRVREPDLRDAPSTLTVAGDVATYTYPYGPVDAEALLVERGRPFLITKERPNPDTSRVRKPRLLAARRFADGQLRNLGAIPLPEPEAGGWAAAFYGNVATGGELAGGRVVLRTYDHVLVYTADTENAPLRTLARWTPREIDTPQLPQGEAVTMNDCGVWLVSEGTDSVWLVPLPRRGFDNAQEQACPNGSAHS